MAKAVEKISYTLDEAAEATGVNVRTIKRALHDGSLTAYYPTSRPLILRETLMAWVTTDRKTA